jgi:hypothetical protein
VPFFVAADPRRLAPPRVQVWATAFPSHQAAAAHAQMLAQPCVIIEALHLAEAVCALRAPLGAPVLPAGGKRVCPIAD